MAFGIFVLGGLCAVYSLVAHFWAPAAFIPAGQLALLSCAIMGTSFWFVIRDERALSERDFYYAGTNIAIFVFLYGALAGLFKLETTFPLPYLVGGSLIVVVLTFLSVLYGTLRGFICGTLMIGGMAHFVYGLFFLFFGPRGEGASTDYFFPIALAAFLVGAYFVQEEDYLPTSRAGRGSDTSKGAGLDQAHGNPIRIDVLTPEANRFAGQGKQFIFDTWNREFPAAVSLRDTAALDGMLEQFSEPTFIVAYRGELPAGFLFYGVRPGDPLPAFIMAVSSAHQGWGVGRVLIERARELSPEGLCGWAVYTDDQLKADGSVYQSPIEFYKHMGFTLGEQVVRNGLAVQRVMSEPRG